MSLKTTVDAYKQAKYLYREIDEVFNSYEEETIDDSSIDTTITKTVNDINKLNNLLNKINVRDLEGHYSAETIENVKSNVDLYFEGADYIEKYLTAKKYYSSLLNGVENYLEKIKLAPEEYSSYAKSEHELAKKFTAMLLHPTNSPQFINQIKRMALGTMSQNEFTKIFNTNKSRMQKNTGLTFQSFSDYKEKNK